VELLHRDDVAFDLIRLVEVSKRVRDEGVGDGGGKV